MNDVDGDCFVSAVMITVKSDKSVKIGLTEIKSQLYQNATAHAEYGGIIEPKFGRNTRDRTLQLFISKRDLDYAYGQLILSDEKR